VGSSQADGTRSIAFIRAFRAVLVKLEGGDHTRVAEALVEESILHSLYRFLHAKLWSDMMSAMM
jgi:hypothetical protein